MKFEVWMEDDGTVEEITVVNANATAQEKDVGENAKLIHEFEAFTNFEKMNKYHKLMGWNEYKAYWDDDHEPFKEE